MKPALLGPTEVRALCQRLELRPRKAWGQNFVVDPGQVRRVVAAANLPDAAASLVVEVGPGLGSLTLALLEAGAQVVAVEIDPVLAGELPRTVAERAPGLAARCQVIRADAMKLDQLPPRATALVANLPYNVAVPVLLTFLERFGQLERALVMVQAEVAARLVSPPGSRTYGAPSAKLAWFASARLAGAVPRNAFYPVPRVDSALVLAERRAVPAGSVTYQAVARVIDAAFSARRKTLRSALAGWAGSAERAAALCQAAGIDPGLRGETLAVEQFAALAEVAAAEVADG